MSNTVTGYQNRARDLIALRTEARERLRRSEQERSRLQSEREFLRRTLETARSRQDIDLYASALDAIIRNERSLSENAIVRENALRGSQRDNTLIQTYETLIRTLEGWIQVKRAEQRTLQARLDALRTMQR
jgi:hypothetical protein